MQEIAVDFVYSLKENDNLIVMQNVWFKAQNNGQQVAGHDDRPNIF